MKRKSKLLDSNKSNGHSWWRWAVRALLLLGLLLGAWLIYLDMEVREKFDGRKWALPARVYAQPLELYNGKQLLLQDLRSELKLLEYRPVRQVSLPGQWSLEQGAVELFVRSHDLAGKKIPARHVRFRFSGDEVSDFQVLKGEPASLVSLDPVLIGGIYPRRQEDRELVKLEQVPPLLGEALIAVEDRAFIRHFGVSPKAIARAAWTNFKSGKVVQGGSTLTQQLVKNFFLTDSRKLSRKLVEAAMSVLLELHYSKAEILETYINEVYLGQSGPRQIHGFGLAAKHYFKRPLEDLQKQELALLVGLVKGASFYNPWRHPERARERRNLVLDLLAQQQLLSAEEATKLKALPLGVVPASESYLQDYPAFIDLVKNQLRRDYSDEALSSEGLSVYTTLSLTAQRHAERALANRVRQLEGSYQLTPDSLQGAVILAAVGSGEVEAVVGDRNPRYSGFNRALNASRPIGSLVKPAVYLTALREGAGYHLASLISDAPVTVEGPDQSLWQPDNFDHRSHGDVLLIDALTQSYNQATARLGMMLGLDRVAHTLQQLGVDKPVPKVPAMLLGSLELTPMDVAMMYHTLANDGVLVNLRAIRSVVDASGQQLSRYPLALNDGMAAGTINLMQYALQSVMREGTGKSIYRKLPDSLALAGKTGTSNEQRDSWFAGFSGRHLGVVWLGRDDNGSTPLTGATGALQVWGDVFEQMPTEGLDIMPAPELEYLWVDGQTGGLSGENCYGARLMPFRHSEKPSQRAECRWRENPVLHWLRRWL